MNGRNRWLGYLAVGLGALALIVSLGGRFSGPRMYGGGPWGHDRGSAQAPQVQPAPQAPGAPQAPAPHRAPRDFGRHWGPGPQEGQGATDPRFFDRGHRDFGRHGGHGPHWGPFGFPFMILRGLRDALVAGLLILIGLRLLQGRRGPSNGGTTGETTRL